MTNNDELALKMRKVISHGAPGVWLSPIEVEALLAERDADKKRIAELEARTVSVKLPKTIWYEHDDLARDVAVLEKRLVRKALREGCAAAGVNVEFE